MTVREYPTFLPGQELPAQIVNWIIQDLQGTASGDGLTVVDARTIGFTLALGDARKWIPVDSATPVTVTIPVNASVAIPVSSLIAIEQRGAAAVTVEGENGVTITTAPGVDPTTSALGTVIYFKKVAEDEWVLTGDAVGATPASASLGDLSDVDISSPTDGQALVYDSGTGKWVNSSDGALDYVHIAGDTMTGALVLPGDPASDLEAATKLYVDNQVAGVVSQIPPPGLSEGDVQTLINNAILNLQGTPTGVVTNVDVTSGNVTLTAGPWATTDTYNIINATTTGRTVTLPSGVSGTRSIVSARTNTRAVSIIKGTTTYRLPAGGFIIIYLDGSANYMRIIAAGGASADYVLRSGDTMAGALYLASTLPGADAVAASKAYVDTVRDELRQVTISFAGGNAETVPIPLAFSIVIPAGTYSEAIRGTVAATGSTAYTIKKNGSTIGTGTIGAAATVGSLVVGSAVTITGGGTDDFDAAGPATADATLVGVSLSVPYRRLR